MQQSSMIDIVPLALLVLFFGIQQRGRRQVFYRYWFAGWVCVLLSYFAWGLEITGILLNGLTEMARLDLLLLAALVFLSSFLSTALRLRHIALMGLLAGVPGVIVMDLQQNHTVPKALLFVVVLAWEGYGLYAANALLQPECRFRRRLLFALCVVWFLAMSVHIGLTGAHDLSEWALAEVFLAAAILYGIDHRRTTLAGVLGTVGFTVWAAFYALAVLTRHWLMAFVVLNQFWNLPKYLVAFSMILKIFEDARDEEARLAEQNRSMYEDFRLLFDNNPHPAMIYAEQTQQILLANQAAVAAYGYSKTELLALRTFDLKAVPDAECDAIEGILPPIMDGDCYRIRHRDGHDVWVNVTGHSICYQETAARLVVVRDVTKKIKMDLEMLNRANSDPLTGLLNRRLLEERMETAMARSIRENKKMAVFTIDIDHFKKINDTYGHLFGDGCLKAVAERLNANIRKTDTLARVGGEEFVALIGGLNLVADAERIAKNLLRLFETPLQMAEHEHPVTISIGVAVFPDDGYDSQTLYQRSDEALYAAKQAGRNRSVCAGALTINPLTAYQKQVSTQETPRN